ncbi:MAG: ATP-binding cassette domain-containing protein [Bacteroidales bacterium]|nr:ATP-binding cassette domain-containing protein [Bacteroidales bacterium]
MALLSLQNIQMAFGGPKLLDGVTLQVEAGERICLLGRNGEGKSTLLKLICGDLVPDDGTILRQSGVKVARLTQKVPQDIEGTVFDLVSSDWNHEHALDHPVEKVISLMNLDPQQAFSDLSGGMRRRALLAKALVNEPDVLILDEPTNHLDIESIQWLEDFLSNYFGAVILVSHDRAFLDNLCNRTIEISDERIFDYKSAYTEYVRLREERLEQQLATYNNQQKQIRQIERFIERFRYKNTKARQVQSKIKMLDRLDTVEIEGFDNAAIHFKFPPAPRSGKVVVECSGLGKSYGNNQVLKNLDLSIIKGDRVAFVGKNGEGKTTLSKVFIGLLEYEGELKFGHNVKLAYYAQDQAEMLDGNKTVFETIDDEATGDMRSQVRNLLGGFLFSGEDIDKKVRVLSGGEKSRLSLARLLLEPSNFMILDEPTNHLDMRSKDILKSALLQYEGTLVIVSHDRDFLQGLSNKVFEFRNKGVKEYLGDIYDFLYFKKLSNLRELEQKKGHGPQKGKEISRNKELYERSKQLERSIRKLNTQISKCEKRVEELETDLSVMDKVLMDPAQHKEALSNPEVFKKYNSIKISLEKEMERWEKLSIELESLKQEQQALKSA